MDEMPDPRVREMCTYSSRHLQWQAIATFLLRGGSRNAFDADRNSGAMPANLLRLGEEVWDEGRLGARRTVTCSGNVVRHMGRVVTDAFAALPLRLARRLMEMRVLDRARLFGHWWLIIIDGTLMDRGRDSADGSARHRYVVEAVLVGPCGLRIPIMSEFADVRDPVRDKEDCELNAFQRITERLKREFPRLPVCLLLDGLYPVKAVFDRCREYGWKFIATLREGRQPTAWDEAVQIMLASPANVRFCRRQGEHGEVEQTMRWADRVPFGGHQFQVIFLGEVGPEAATLWAWATNLLVTQERVGEIVNGGAAPGRRPKPFSMSRRTAGSGWSTPSAQTSRPRTTSMCSCRWPACWGRCSSTACSGGSRAPAARSRTSSSSRCSAAVWPSSPYRPISPLPANSASATLRSAAAQQELPPEPACTLRHPTPRRRTPPRTAARALDRLPFHPLAQTPASSPLIWNRCKPTPTADGGAGMWYSSAAWARCQRKGNG